MNNFKFYNNPSKIDTNKWKSFCEGHTYNTVFQSFEIYDFWKNQENNNPFIFFVESNDGDCLAFCAGTVMSTGRGFVKHFSSRAIIFGGPLLKEGVDVKQILPYLLNNMEKELKSSSIYLEIRNFYKDLLFDDIFKNMDWIYTPYQNYIIPLISEEAVFKKFHSERRRQIRKGLREGVTVTFDPTPDNILGVYKVLVKIYGKIKKPLPSLEYFSNLIEFDFAGIVTVKFENKIIGGGYFLWDKQTIYDWYRGGLDVENKNKYPSAIADWSIMKFGLEQGIEKFDFMGAGIKGKEYGVRVYKSRFRGDLVEYGRFTKIIKPRMYKVGSFGLEVANKLILRIESSKLIKH